MTIRIRNKVYLKKNIEQELYYAKVFELLKVIIPNHKRVYGDFVKYYEGLIEVDEFDSRLYRFLPGMGDCVMKIKEIAEGIWMIREPRGVCYIYEPKGMVTKHLLGAQDKQLCA